MRSPLLPGLAALAAALLTARAAAQEGPQPRLVLSIGGGAHTGHELWTIPAQPVEIPPNTNVYDSLRLARSIGSGLLITFAATYFPSGHVGFYGDVTFMDMGMENSCSPVVPYKPDLDPGDGTNEQLCNNFNASVSGNSALLVGLGVALRPSPRGSMSPYLRAGLGYARLAHGTVAAEAPNTPTSPPVQIIADADPKAGSPAFLLAAGLTQAIGSGYQLRLEVRDDFFALERVTGPANALGQVTTDTGWYHHISLTIGFDIVFDRKRARRY